MITVAIPAYNGENYLRDAVLSIINQTKEVETILIIDDASKDNTQKIIYEIKNLYYNYNIKSFRNDNNLGYQKNWNKCFEYCKTKYLVVLHQDDMLVNNSIEKQLLFMQNNPSVALVGGKETYVYGVSKITSSPKVVSNNKIYKKGEIYEFVLNEGSYIPCSSVIFNMEKINKIGYFATDVLGTDELYWPGVLSKFPIAILGESLIYRRIHPGQTINIDAVEKFNDIIAGANRQLQIIPYYDSRVELRPKIIKSLRLKFSRNSMNVFESFINVESRRNIALKYFVQAFKFYPFIFTTKSFWKSTVLTILTTLKLRTQ
jgi:glycosyltransferase involved in cell wall biosynthesis